MIIIIDIIGNQLSDNIVVSTLIGYAIIVTVQRFMCSYVTVELAGTYLV